MDIKKCPAYEQIRTEKLTEINSTGTILRHKKTSARVIVVENDDNNKVFDIGFRTPPTDSTGIPHIVEHTVLCGSKNFPVKDPFAELDKGSLNTFLNAMTYPDKTVYPVASCNDKDFQNLMHVYLDAVFYPNIYKEEKIFRQEGWHYELSDIDGELTYNGVVYNEMKGAFSSPDEILENLIQRTLFPDTAYSVVSGGDPADIPKLTWEDYLDFHRRYYHPSNSFIYLYGDMDMEEKLNWIDDNYLSDFDFLAIDSQVRMQKPFEVMQEATDYYPLTVGESTEAKTYFSYNCVCEVATDEILSHAFEVLEYALVNAIGAPVKEALINAGIGTEIEGGYTDSFLQPFFTITAKNARDDQKDDFLMIVRETLSDLADGGLDKNSILAAIQSMEFQFREADFGRYPKGLMYGLTMYDSWLYDDDKPFINLRIDHIFKFLREQVDTGYYENLIRKYLIDNTHSAFVCVYPEVGLAGKKQDIIKNELAEYKRNLSEDELNKIIEQTRQLKKYQEEPSSAEQLATIPMLTLDDLDKKAAPIVNDMRKSEGVPVLYHDVFTGGIIYLRLSFDVTDLREYAPYIGLLTDTLALMDTDKYDKMTLGNEILLHSGGIGVSTDVFTDRNDENDNMRLEIKVKYLYDEAEYIMNLVKEILSATHIDDKKRLKEIIAEKRSMRLAAMQSSGHVIAANRMLAYFKDRGKILEHSKGLSYYEFLCDLENNFDKRIDDLCDILKNLIKVILSPERLLVSITADEKGYDLFDRNFSSFTKCLQSGLKMDVAPAYTPMPIETNEGITTSGNVQYVARGGNYAGKGIEYKGYYRIVKTILGFDYLWNEVRVKGGAYGIMCHFGRKGNAYFVSYRDPHLKETDEIYDTVPEFLRNFKASDREMTKFIIGSIRELDMPLTPQAKGVRSYNLYMEGRTYEDLQKEREDVLNADVDDIKSTADMVEAFLSDKYICVVGSEEKMKECADIFGGEKVLR